MTGRWQRRWREQPALAVLIVAIPLIVIAGLAWRAAEAPPQFRPATYRVQLADLSHGRADSAPALGMRLAAGGFATIDAVPAVRAPMVDSRVAQGAISGMVQPDIARFIKAWPFAIPLDPGSSMQTTTLDLRPEHSPQGARLILRDGCLRVRKRGWKEERLVVPLGPLDLFRDEQNYLSTGTPDGAAEYRLRIGEPGGLIWVGPVADSQLEGVAALRAACGTAPIVLMGQAPKRLPVCSADYLARFADRRRALAAEYEAQSKAQSQAAAACREGNAARGAAERARGGPVTPPVPCPPMMPPPPPPEAIGGDVCRAPGVPLPE